MWVQMHVGFGCHCAGVRISPLMARFSAVGAVEGEDEVVGVFAVEEIIERDAAAFADQLTGFDRLVIGAPAGAGAEFGGVAGHGIQDSAEAWGSWWRRCRDKDDAGMEMKRGSKKVSEVMIGHSAGLKKIKCPRAA